MTTTTLQLLHWMRFDPTFIGVFSLDTIPHVNEIISGFIVNTDTANLPGQHWIAVRIVQDQAWIFDPLALLPPTQLCQHLVLHCDIRILHICNVPTQPVDAFTCGLHCVYFLYTATPADSETALYHFVSNL